MPLLRSNSLFAQNQQLEKQIFKYFCLFDDKEDRCSSNQLRGVLKNDIGKLEVLLNLQNLPFDVDFVTRTKSENLLDKRFKKMKTL